MAVSSATSVNRFGHAVWAITLREFRNRYGTRRLGLFWAFVEPSAYVFVFSVLMSALRSTTSPLGIHIAPFIAMGIMSYMMFNATEGFVRGALRSNKSLLSFPRIKPIDIYVGRLVMEVATLVVVFFCMFSLFIMTGLADPPSEPVRLFLPLATSITLGFAVGIINSTLTTIFRAWENIYSVLSRLNFFTSGIFFIADGMPTEIQRMLYYQPLLHLSEWVRSAWFGHFESRFLDRFYLAMVVSIALLLALLLERTFRKNVLNNL
jgi:capsular polysaccharide transport system permease protein